MAESTASTAMVAPVVVPRRTSRAMASTARSPTPAATKGASAAWASANAVSAGIQNG